MTDLATDTKTCPFCAETIKAEAVVCRFCGRNLTPAPSRQDVDGRVVCQECGHANSRTRQTCKNCGVSLRSTAASPSTAGPRVPSISSGQIICSNCGHTNPLSNTKCQRCATPLELPRREHRPSSKASSNPLVIGALVVGLLCVATLLFNGGTGGRAGGVPLLAPATTSHKVIYELTGTADEASITVTNEQGGNEQRDVDMPYSRELTLPPRAFAYLSAQNKDEDGGRLVCRIWVDGEIWRESESSGFAKIATCSGRVGE